jgi:hypothetical protein
MRAVRPDPWPRLRGRTQNRDLPARAGAVSEGRRGSVEVTTSPWSRAPTSLPERPCYGSGYRWKSEEHWRRAHSRMQTHE